MTLLEWKSTDEAARRRLCQQLNPYEDWAFFKEVEAAFYAEFGSREGISQVFCGVAGGLGGVNAVTVTIASGKERVMLPKHFMGFPIIRRYEKMA